MEQVQSSALTCGVNLENKEKTPPNHQFVAGNRLFRGDRTPEGKINPSTEVASPKATQTYENIHGKPSHSSNQEDLADFAFARNARKFTEEERRKFPEETDLLHRFKVVLNLPKDKREIQLCRQLKNQGASNLLNYPKLMIRMAHNLFSSGRSEENLSLLRAVYLARNETISLPDSLALGHKPESYSALLSNVISDPQSAIEQDPRFQASDTASAMSKWDKVPNVPEALLEEMYGDASLETHEERCFRFAFDWISGQNDAPSIETLIENRTNIRDSVVGSCIYRLIRTQRFDLAAACLKAADPSLTTLSSQLESYDIQELTNEAKRLLQTKGSSESPLWQGCLVEVLCDCSDPEKLLSDIENQEFFEEVAKGIKQHPSLNAKRGLFEHYVLSGQIQLAFGVLESIPSSQDRASICIKWLDNRPQLLEKAVLFLQTCADFDEALKLSLKIENPTERYKAAEFGFQFSSQEMKIAFLDSLLNQEAVDLALQAASSLKDSASCSEEVKMHKENENIKTLIYEKAIDQGHYEKVFDSAIKDGVTVKKWLSEKLKDIRDTLPLQVKLLTQIEDYEAAVDVVLKFPDPALRSSYAAPLLTPEDKLSAESKMQLVQSFLKDNRIDLAISCVETSKAFEKTVLANTSEELDELKEQLISVEKFFLEANSMLDKYETIFEQINTFNDFSVPKQKKALETFCVPDYVKYLFPILEQISSEEVLDHFYEKLATGGEPLATSLYTYTGDNRHLDQSSRQTILERATLKLLHAGFNSKAQNLYNQLTKTQKHQLYERLLDPLMSNEIMTLILAEADGNVKLYVCQRLSELLSNNMITNKAELENLSENIQIRLSEYYKKQLTNKKQGIDEGYEIVEPNEI